jgi:hypothetical protein
MTTVDVRIPLPETKSAEHRGTTVTYAVAQKRVALVNNGWGSADDLVGVFERTLREDYGVTDVAHYKRNEEREGTSAAADEAFLAGIVESSDVAITMLGNCGGCTSWTCNTSAELERRGVYSAAVVTGLFEPLAAFTLAKTNKTPDHPLVVLSDHFEHTDRQKLEEAAVTTLRELFGEGGAEGARALDGAATAGARS